MADIGKKTIVTTKGIAAILNGDDDAHSVYLAHTSERRAFTQLVYLLGLTERKPFKVYMDHVTVQYLMDEQVFQGIIVHFPAVNSGKEVGVHER